MKKWSNISAHHFDDDKYMLIVRQNDGWEIHLDPTIYCFYLYNSTSKVKFQLPQVEEKITSFSKCIISSDSSESEDIVVLMLIYDEFKAELHLRCEVDEQWHKGSLEIPDYLGDPDEVFCDVVTFNGKFYGFNRYYEIVEILIPQQGTTQMKPRFRLTCSGESSSWFETARFVVSCNELFVVYILTNTKFGGVFKFDALSSKFIPTYNLRDQVFFLNGTYSTSFSGAKLGQLANCVCFTDQGNEVLYLMNLEDTTLSVKVHAAGFNNFFLEESMLFSCYGLTKPTQTTSEEHKKEEDSEASLIMSKLPLHLQEHVAKFVNKGRDYLNFRSVCTAWKSITPARQWITSNEFVECPWLISIKRDNGTCKLSDPKDNATYLMSDPELSDCVIRCSKDGWLLVSIGFRTMFLYEPFAKKKIELPKLKDTDTFCNGICLSDNPSSSKVSIVAFYHLYTSVMRIVYHNLGDQYWTYITFYPNVPFTPSYINPIFSNGAVYCLSREGNLGVFKLTDLTWEILSISAPLISLPPATKMVPNFLLSHEQDIYSIYVSNVAGEFVKVYRLADILSDGGGKGEWEELKSLGDMAIFVCEASCFALVAPDSIMANMIYFPCFSLINNKHVCYCLESGKYRTFGGDGGDISTKGLYDTKEQLHCSWIQPRLASSSW